MINDWKKTCEKCMDGEVEPMHCEYYGEPNGCNSPTYGEHPPTGNTAAMRYALEAFVEYSELALRMGMFNRDRLVAITTKAHAALTAPPRNCDVGTAEEQEERFKAFCNAHSCSECPARGGWRYVYIDGTSFKMIQCGVKWAQMPYEEGGAK